MATLQTITLIGSGNVATHLGRALLNKGFTINEVYSKSINNASLLALKLNATATDNIKQLNDKSDAYLICIKDGFIENIIKQFNLTDKIIAHTSGSVDMDLLGQFINHGILYPLQTFSKEVAINMDEVPFCVEANNAHAEHLLLELGKSLSKSVHRINSEQRKKIHLAAVFACNFSNYMYTISEDILNQNNIDFSILKPLIIETARKIKSNSPKSIQTGPAKRKDEAVIKNHIELLANAKDYQDIYKIITENIIKSN